MPLDDLLDKLNQLYTVNPPFRFDIKSMMYFRFYDKRVKLMDFGERVKWAAYIEEGFVVGIVIRDGKEVVARIFQSGDIFTNMRGFFNDGNATMMLIALTPCKLWILDREDYKKLEIYPETLKLKEAMQFVDQEIDAELVHMLKLQVPDRFAYFASRYAFQHLSNKMCASLLNIHETDYCKYKNEYLRRK